MSRGHGFRRGAPPLALCALPCALACATLSVPDERSNHGIAAPARHEAAARAEPRGRATASADELGILLLHAGEAIRAAVFGEPYDADFECSPGDLAADQRYPAPPEKRDLDILYVNFNAYAGTEGTPPEQRKVWVKGIAFPDGRSQWLHVYGFLNPYWGAPPVPLDEAPSPLRRALLTELDPATSTACHPHWDPTTPERLCGIRNHGPDWEAACVKRLLSEQAETTASCARLGPPVPGEKLVVAVGHVTVSIGRNGREENLLESFFARVDKEKLCLWKAHFRI